MAISVDDLEKLVLSYASGANELEIISGYFSYDELEKIAKLGLPTKYYYGMYLKNGISTSNYNALLKLETSYSNFRVFIPIVYHVHTKCYLFRASGVVTEALVGSANCSSSALLTTPKSELLMPVDDPADKLFLDQYAKDVYSDSVPISNPIVVPTSRATVLKTYTRRSKGTPKSWNCYSGNPFSAIIPLYYMDKGRPIVHAVDGLNWGNGPHASKSSDMESVLPIRKYHIDHYPSLIPYNGSVGSGSGGKINRMQAPIDMTWDDGTIMKMVFQQGGVTVPPPSKRAAGAPYRTYPKALTANSGGVELGNYMRDRLGLPHNADVTYADLRKYGRDYVTLTLTNAGNYELDFHV